MIVLIHAANVLYVLSYLVKDILWLRLLTVAAGSILLTYYVLEPVPVWAAIGWNILFLAINLRQIQVLLLERRPVHLPPEELGLYQLAFRSLTPREFAKLLRVGGWQSVPAGETFVRRGVALERVMIIAAGHARVQTGAGTVVELGPGRFVGEMSYLTGEAPGADVVATEATRVVAWPQKELRTFLGKDAALHAVIARVIGEDLVAKLQPGGPSPAAGA
ncbi:MAG TPA: cyclic nucleotide-binding domain-containing protein [Polyangiaceae bacterium]|jgi:hypothetical protein